MSAQIRLRLRERDPRREPSEHGEEREVARRDAAVIELQRFPSVCASVIRNASAGSHR